jgi:hypothetical protein
MIGFCTVGWLTGRTTLGMWPTFHTAEEDISQTRTLNRSDLCLTHQPDEEKGPGLKWLKI